ncbi:MAG: 5'-nucleotidase, lipoprotein e(P4) family [Pirellulaceae bacterium]
MIRFLNLLIVSISLFLQCPTALEAQQSNEAAVHEDLDAVTWMQTSAEYAAITRQTFRQAQFNLGIAIVDPGWTASTEQATMFADSPEDLAGLPPAIVVDVDETVLDNSAFQVGLIEADKEFSTEEWLTFCRRQESPAIPGAVPFLNSCRAAGVAVLFVTNRDHVVEDATRQNLIDVGLLLADDPDTLFTKNEQEDWTSNKQSRREFLAGQYRILLLLGDDLNDFVDPGYYGDSNQRRLVGNEFSDMWGQRWMMMPNPTYGGWERSLYNWDNSASRETKLKTKRAALRR